MHRHLQFGMRENPASDRRHGSRVAVGSEEFSDYVKKQDRVQGSPSVRNEPAGVVSENAADCAATVGVKSLIATKPVRLEHSQVERIEGRGFEPLIGSGQAARLLGNIHVKTLQRYARLGRLPGYQIAGHWYFRESELDAWLQHQINSKCQSVR